MSKLKESITVRYVKPATADFQSADEYWTLTRKQPKWITKIILNVLSWLGFKSIGNPDYLPAGEVKIDDIAALINTNKNIVEQVFGRQVKYLLIGQDAMLKLKLRLNVGAFSFENGEVTEPTGGVTKWNQFAGMDIVLIPWMNGVLAVHDLTQIPRFDEVQGVPAVDVI